MSRVDYISLTGWALDNGSVWTSGTNYGYNHVVHTGTDSSVYQQTTAGCQSTVQPTGTRTGMTTADGCSWDYKGKIYYTSNSHPLPHEEFYYGAFTGSISGMTLTLTMPPASYPLAVGQYLNAPGIAAGTKITAGSGTTWTVNNSQTLRSTTMFSSLENAALAGINNLYVADLWNDREYQSGAFGENSPITMWNHNDHYNDSKSVDIPSPSNTASGFGFPITIQAAPGESFQDTLTANSSIALAGYNVANGVGIRGVGVVGFYLLDNALDLHGLQIKSTNDYTLTSFPGRGCNACSFDHDILEGGTGGAGGVAACGAQCFFYNDLVIAHEHSGILLDYGGRVYNSTIVCPEGTCVGAAVEDSWDWITLFGVVLNGNAMFGFAHLIATLQPNPSVGGSPNCTWDCATWQGTGNATDVASTDGNTYPAVSYIGYNNGSSTMYAQNFQTGRHECSYYRGGSLVPSTCGITNSMSASAAFVTWPGNYRINGGSPLVGTGASYGSFNLCGVVSGYPIPTWSGCTVQGDTPDIIGTARPQGARYDIGAMEFVGGAQSPVKTRAR